jgi:hypothetical protein
MSPLRRFGIHSDATKRRWAKHSAVLPFSIFAVPARSNPSRRPPAITRRTSRSHDCHFERSERRKKSLFDRPNTKSPAFPQAYIFVPLAPALSSAYLYLCELNVASEGSMTPPGLSETKADHTALAVRVAQNTRSISRRFRDDTAKQENGEPKAPRFQLLSNSQVIRKHSNQFGFRCLVALWL